MWEVAGLIRDCLWHGKWEEDLLGGRYFYSYFTVSGWGRKARPADFMYL